jgi:hypothetical protein
MRYLDPTISNYTKAITSGIAAAHVYAVRMKFDNEHGEAAEREVALSMLKLALEEGDLVWQDVPEWAQLAIQGEHYRIFVGEGLYDTNATAPAAELSSHVERKLTRKRRETLEAMEKQRQARERADTRLVNKLEQLAGAWGCRVKSQLAPLKR